MDKETWLLWMLADSQLPTGGFVASAGLEAAMQGGLVREQAREEDRDSFVTFIRDSTHNQARFAVPFCARVHELVSSRLADSELESKGEDQVIQELVDELASLDSYHHAMVSSNRVAMRALIAQGGGLLSLFNRGYAHAKFMNTNRRGQACIRVAKELQRQSRLEMTRMHWPYSRMQQLYLFQFLRQIFSAAIRLNLIGPLRAQTLECDMLPLDIFGESVVYTDPMLELYQGMHDRLYSRIFNS
ncbi:hypothetical protein DL89DRAFT_295417 [Linderina pennispora]|uniref:Urease accessory protein UreF n=1 Tax=Linderina pennispora TaxID=61395 RepID=A0A1Y1VZ58_9FUNG|nr:uncharacterized protein DL89DRAFT_295417 [Linderina pennispora]ORX66557.1 hypothetical protein DL89DRAFT_295417 [Linderina pennispora]